MSSPSCLNLNQELFVFASWALGVPLHFFYSQLYSFIGLHFRGRCHFSHHLDLVMVDISSRNMFVDWIFLSFTCIFKHLFLLRFFLRYHFAKLIDQFLCTRNFTDLNGERGVRTLSNAKWIWIKKKPNGCYFVKHWIPRKKEKREREQTHFFEYWVYLSRLL